MSAESTTDLPVEGPAQEPPGQCEPDRVRDYA
jgi:hypothetical protein